MKVKRLSKECWYPAVSSWGVNMPYDENFFHEELILKENQTPNQMTPLLLSNYGQCIYKKEGFKAKFEKDYILVDDNCIVQKLDNLKQAFKYCSENYFEKNEIAIADELKVGISYNTWMHAPIDITQEKTLDYAKKLLDLGLPPSTLIIDDKWSYNYGSLNFEKAKFKEPKKMIEELHNMGFKVMLWFCPFVSFKTYTYNLYYHNNWLLKEDNKPYKLKWWNETSACVDLRNEEAFNYLKNRMDRLINIGIDGFKMDGGDSLFYLKEHEPDKQSYLWSKLASYFKYNEIRVDFNTSGMSIFERLCDKKHSFGNGGIKDIVPASLALGLGGHPFFATDMVGGGEVQDIRDKCELQKDIFISHIQIGLLMPNIQFSILPDKVLGKDLYILKALLNQRKEYEPYLNELAKISSKTKEPIVRLLEYEFPNQGFSHITDMFMLGDKYLVVPITKKNETSKEISLPKGSKWQFEECIYNGGEKIKIDLVQEKLAVIKKI